MVRPLTVNCQVQDVVCLDELHVVFKNLDALLVVELGYPALLFPVEPLAAVFEQALQGGSVLV